MWDFKCLTAALCFLTSNVLFIVDGVLIMKENNSNAQTANANDGDINQNIYDSSNAYDIHKEHSIVKPMSFQYRYWKDLNPTYIESRWVQREQQRPIMMSAALFGAIAWFWMMVPIVQSAWVLSRGGKRSVGAHVTLAGLAVCGSIIELLARLMIVGMTNASEWMAKDFNLDDWSNTVNGDGWRVLEMIHIVTRGLLLWIDAFEALALFGIVMVIFYSLATEPKFRFKRNSPIFDYEQDDTGEASSGRIKAASGALGDTNPGASPPQSAFAAVTPKAHVKPTFTSRFAWFGLFVGLLAVTDFFADVLRFINWRFFGRMAMATNALLGVIFLPTWLVCLAKQLPEATGHFEREEQRASVLFNV